MCKRKSKPIRESNNYLFTILIGVQVLFVFVFGACAFFKIPCPKELQNAIGVAMQIITALAAVVISIIGISISLQNEEVFGTKTTKLYNLRLEPYSVKCIVIIPIALCTLSTIFYLVKWYWMVLGMLAATTSAPSKVCPSVKSGSVSPSPSAGFSFKKARKMRSISRQPSERIRLSFAAKE